MLQCVVLNAAGLADAGPVALSEVRSSGAALTPVITVRSRTESKPPDSHKEGRLGSRRSLIPSLLQLRRENGRKRYFAVDGLLNDVLYRRADF